MEKACASELMEKEASGFHGSSGSVLVYRFTRTNTKDPTMFTAKQRFVKKGVQWLFPLCTGTPGHNRSSHDVKKVEGTFPECLRCGKTNHSVEKCFYWKAQCHGCQKLGHIKTKCPEKRAPRAKGGESKKSREKRKRKPGGIHSIEQTVTMTEPLDKTAWPMFTVVDSQGRCKELIVPVLIDVKSVDLELDTGASVTIILNYVWSGVLAAKSLQQTDVKLKSYSKHEIPVPREAKVRVSYGDQQACLLVIVTAGDGPALVRQNWSSVRRLDWKQIRQISLEACDWFLSTHHCLMGAWAQSTE